MSEMVKVADLRELDALVAERVAGWTLAKGRNHYGEPMGAPVVNKRGGLAGIGVSEVPRYSSEIAAAWEVVERLHSEGRSFSVDRGPDKTARWYARFGITAGGAGGATAPIAICLAALRVREVNVELAPEAADTKEQP